MTVWHGSSRAVATPDLLHARDNTDFGRGFYVTPIYEQALSFTHRFKRRGQGGVISRYAFDEAAAKGLDVLRFTSYSDEWLSFVLTCRTGRDESTYDIVTGGVANDRVFNTLELYIDGLIDRREALQRLQYEKPNEQLCLRTQAALSLLHYEGCEFRLRNSLRFAKRIAVLLQKKYARIIKLFADRRGIPMEEALGTFYHSELYRLMSEGAGDIHCMSDQWLCRELEEEAARVAGESSAQETHKEDT